MLQLNTFIEQETDYRKIDSFYKQLFTSIFPWQNYFMDYSLRVELIRWHHYYEILTPKQQEYISPLFHSAYKTALELSTSEVKLTPVINHGGCNYKNLIFTPEVVLLDNEKLHVGWPGIDYADLLVTYVQKNYEVETLDLWKGILLSVPKHIISHEILVGWLLLAVCKKAISETAQLKQISPILHNRTQIFLHLLS